LKVEIITVGDEVIFGHIVDTNAAFLANAVYSLGAKVTRIISVGDDVAAISEVLREATSRADLIIVTGGLGSTPDDLTSQAAAQAFGRRFALHKGYLESIREKFQGWDLKFTPSSERQAMLPEGAQPLPNPIGICGFKLEEAGKTLFFLPGVPREVEKITEGVLLPFLRERIRGKEVIRASLLKIFGPTETGVKELLQDLEGDYELAYLPSFPEIHLRLVVRGADEADVEARKKRYEEGIRKKLGIHLFGKDDEVLEGVVGELLKEKGMTISVAESCTGGLVAHRITEIPGSSDYFLGGVVVYSNQAKEELLGVPRHILERFGPVSRQTAEFMARGVRRLNRTTLALATTGIAGPTGGTPETPVGRVFIALAAQDEVKVRKYDFFGDRHQIKLMASEVTLDMVRRYLLTL